MVVEYADLECPHCARAHLILKELPVTRVFRHFPVTSKHPRAHVLACAAEAAALQGRFWEMHDALLEDQAHLDQPHLWERAERLGLDLERFDRDRRSAAIDGARQARLPLRDPCGRGHDADSVRRRRGAPGRAGHRLARPAGRTRPLLASAGFSNRTGKRMPPTGGGRKDQHD